MLAGGHRPQRRRRRVARRPHRRAARARRPDARAAGRRLWLLRRQVVLEAPQRRRQDVLEALRGLRLRGRRLLYGAGAWLRGLRLPRRGPPRAGLRLLNSSCACGCGAGAGASTGMSWRHVGQTAAAGATNVNKQNERRGRKVNGAPRSCHLDR